VICTRSEVRNEATHARGACDQATGEVRYVGIIVSERQCGPRPGILARGDANEQLVAVVRAGRAARQRAQCKRRFARGSTKSATLPITLASPSTLGAGAGAAAASSS
jgi:hypothetical protein